MKRENAEDYEEVRARTDETVAQLKHRWLCHKRLDAEDPCRVVLRLVRRGPGAPDDDEETRAARLEPRLTLAEAGVVHGSTLLVKFAAAPRSGGGSPGTRARPCQAPTRVQTSRSPVQAQTALAAVTLQEKKVSSSVSLQCLRPHVARAPQATHIRCFCRF